MIYNTNRSNKSGIYWLTGRPCSGKTTLARAVKDNLAKELPIALLDGDIVRDMLPPLGFTRADRSLQLGRTASIAQQLQKLGYTVICSLVSPYEEERRYVSTLCNMEVIYVRCSLDLCIDRDVKGMYKQALAGEIDNFTGINDPYEEPESPNLILDTETLSIDECVESLSQFILK